MHKLNSLVHHPRHTECWQPAWFYQRVHALAPMASCMSQTPGPEQSAALAIRARCLNSFRPGAGRTAWRLVREAIFLSPIRAGGAILRVTPSGELSMFASEYDGHEFTGPNDLAFGLPETCFSLTPAVSRPQIRRSAPSTEPLRDGVVSPFAVDLAYPNGVAFSPDGKELYVSEMRANRLLAFEITELEQLAQYRMVRRFREPAPPGRIGDRREGANIGSSAGHWRIVDHLRGREAGGVVLRPGLATFKPRLWRP